MLWCGPSSWAYGFPRFAVVSSIRVMDYHAWVWPCELGSWTTTLWRGPSNWGHGFQRFGVARGIPVMDS